MADPQIKGLPPGVTLGQPVQQDTPVSGLPPGVTLGSPVQEDTPVGGGTETVQPEQSFLSKATDFGASMGAGVAQAGLDTVHGVSSLLHKIPGIGEYLAPKAGIDAEGKLAENIDKTPNMGEIYQKNPDTMHAAKVVGYGGENLAEFMLGDEALQGMSMADKFKHISGALGILEKSPRVMRALQMGADVGKAAGQLSDEARTAIKNSPLLSRLVGAGMDAIRQATVQTGQTAVKTGGDVKKAAEQGAETGLASGVLGGAFGLLGRAAEKAGDAGKAVQEASETGAAAPTKVEIGKNVAGQIQDAETQMHTDFETGIQGLKKKLGDAKVPYQGSPLQKSAVNALESSADVPTQKTTTLGKEFQGLGGGSDTSKKLLLGLTDLSKTGDLTIDELVQRRQQLGEKIGQLTRGATSSADRADVGVYQKLRDGIDQTIDALAKNSGKPEASQDYADLRNAYKGKVNLFKEPVIRAMQEGDLDSAGKYLLAGGKVSDKINTLASVIGDQGVKDFGANLIKSTMQEATSESGKINPAQFVKGFKKIDSLPPEVKEKLFDTKAVQNNLMQLASGVKSAANYQKLARLGLIGSAATGGIAHPVLGGAEIALGLLGKGAGVDGAKLLDTIANNPKLWAAFRTAGTMAEKASQSPTARVAKSAAAYGAGNALGNVLQGANEPLSQQTEDNQ